MMRVRIASGRLGLLFGEVLDYGYGENDVQLNWAGNISLPNSALTFDVKCVGVK